MNEDITRYPLCWPPGRPRTPASERTHSQFHRRARVEGASYTQKASITLAGARRALTEELTRLGAQNVVLSTNIELTRYGEPRSDRKPPTDPGAAVYFTHAGRDMAFACDRWSKVEENVRAIAKTIEALRGIERWGTGDMVAAAFTGFTELPAHAPPPHWSISLEVARSAPDSVVIDRYRALAKQHHPDRNGGEDTKMKEVNLAFDAFKRERGI